MSAALLTLGWVGVLVMQCATAALVYRSRAATDRASVMVRTHCLSLAAHEVLWSTRYSESAAESMAQRAAAKALCDVVKHRQEAEKWEST